MNLIRNLTWINTTQIHGALKSRKIKCGRGTGELMKGKSKLFTPEQIEWFKVNYPLLSRKNLTIEFNKKFNQDKKESQIVGFLKANKIKSGRTAHFVKGQPSWSKGKKGVLKANSGSFKKGQKAHNHLPVGSERIVEGGYLEIKIAEPNKWKGKNRLVWEKHNGPIPENHNVRFKDSNPANCEIENLFLVNKSEHLYLTNLDYKSHPEECQETVILMARVQSKTNLVSEKRS